MKVTMLLPCELTDDEWVARSRDLASLEAILADAEAAEVEAADEYKARKKRLAAETQTKRANVARLAQIVRTRSEERNVEVKTETDFEASRVQTVRVDTGEVVSTRPMTETDRQREMFKDGVAPTAEAPTSDVPAEDVPAETAEGDPVDLAQEREPFADPTESHNEGDEVETEPEEEDDEDADEDEGQESGGPAGWEPETVVPERAKKAPRVARTRGRQPRKA